MNRDIVLHDLGLLDYQKAVEYQTKIFNKIRVYFSILNSFIYTIHLNYF